MSEGKEGCNTAQAVIAFPQRTVFKYCIAFQSTVPINGQWPYGIKLHNQYSLMGLNSANIWNNVFMGLNSATSKKIASSLPLLEHFPLSSFSFFLASIDYTSSERATFVFKETQNLQHSETFMMGRNTSLDVIRSCSGAINFTDILMQGVNSF